MIETIRVALERRAYDIVIGPGVLESIGAFVTARCAGRKTLVVTDTTVAAIYERPVVRALEEAGLEVRVLALPPGERSKCLSELAGLYDVLIDHGMDRRSPVVALGGGVVGDLAGFAAATYMRGVPLVQVPTTLLAQVDSSVGGKTAIDHARGKNLIGAFHQPAGVLIDIDTLQSLPSAEYLAGLAEAVKYGVILDADLFAYVETHVEALRRRDPSVLTPLVARCCRLKADVVEADETEETGHRAILNYGHTFAHAFESVTAYTRYRHGEAVAVGMLCASVLAERLGLIGPEVTQRQRRLWQALGLPTALEGLRPEAVAEAMARDKKTVGGQLRLVLPRAIGRVEQISGVDAKLIEAVVAEFQREGDRRDG